TLQLIAKKIAQGRFAKFQWVKHKRVRILFICYRWVLTRPVGLFEGTSLSDVLEYPAVRRQAERPDQRPVGPKRKSEPVNHAMHRVEVDHSATPGLNEPMRKR